MTGRGRLRKELLVEEGEIETWIAGQVIALKITFTYSIGYSGNDTFHVTSINDDAGLKIVGISPPLHVSVGSSGTDVMVYLLAPTSAFEGVVKIAAQAS